MTYLVSPLEAVRAHELLDAADEFEVLDDALAHARHMAPHGTQVVYELRELAREDARPVYDLPDLSPITDCVRLPEGWR
jgi:hypothetical protein